ncbi:MAG TPA: hypothetical protein PKG97_02165, partial [Mesotoga infera]|nr:hypothetical protein [Mesotoga infera]
MSGKFFLSVFLLFTVISFGYTFRDFDWYQHESEHFIYIYHPEIEESVPLVEEIAEESYTLLSRFFGNYLSRKIAIVLWGYDDDPNGLANPLIDSVNSITIGLNYVHREDEYWLRTVISHELSHIFQLSSNGTFGSLIRKYLSGVYLPGALQPMWLSEGFAQFGSHLLRADSYDYRRVSFLKDQLVLETPFSEETIVAGYGTAVVNTPAVFEGGDDGHHADPSRSRPLRAGRSDRSRPSPAHASGTAGQKHP